MTDRDHPSGYEERARIPELAALSEPIEADFTEQVMENLSLAETVRDTADGHWCGLACVFREYLDILTHLLRRPTKEESDG